MTIIDSILDLSKGQKATCMYTKEELETFSVEKLQTIYIGIKEIKPWRKRPSKLSPLRRTKKKKKAS